MKSFLSTSFQAFLCLVSTLFIAATAQVSTPRGTLISTSLGFPTKYEIPKNRGLVWCLEGRHLVQGPSSQSTVIYRYSTVYQDITTQLRAAILNGELDTAIALLVVSRDVNGLAAGLRYPPEKLSEYRIVTPERDTDPDVITIKALAGASLRLANCSWVNITLIGLLTIFVYS